MRIKILSDQEFIVFSAGLKDVPERDAAILALLLYCGLRNGEVCALNWGDILEHGQVAGSVYIRTSHGKGDYPRAVDMPALCRDILDRFLWSEIKKGRSGDRKAPVFVALKTKIRLVQRDVQRIVDRHTENILGVRYTPHSLRHTYATRLLKYTNTRVVQVLLGHRSLSSTQVYTHPTSADTADAVNRAFQKQSDKV